MAPKIDDPKIVARLEARQLDLEPFMVSLRDDYVFFLEEIWADRRYDRFAALGEEEREMARWAAFGDGTEATRRRGLLAPRGLGKTHFIVGGLAAWHLYRFGGDGHVVIPSKKEGEAKKTLSLIRGWIGSVWFLRHLIPKPQWETPKGSKPHRDGATMFDCALSVFGDRNPSVAAYGIEGQIEGVRASLMLPDDVETATNTKTQDAREELDTRVKEFTNICTFGDREIVYVGTFHHEESLYLKLSERGYEFRTWPIIAPHPDDAIIGLAPSIKAKIADGRLRASSEPGVFDGDMVFPHRHDRVYISERKSEGRTTFAMQHMLIASLGDSLRYPLRLSDLIVHAVNTTRAPLTIAWGMTNSKGASTKLESIPCIGFTGDMLLGPIFFSSETAPYTGTIMAIDPSGRGKDRTAYTVVSHCNGTLWVHDCDGLVGGYDPATLEKLAKVARDLHVTHIVIEDNFGMGMFASLFEPVLRRHFIREGHVPAGSTEAIQPWSCGIETVPARGQKELRIIEALEAPSNQHRIVIDPCVAQNERFQRQWSRITRQRDCLDSDDEIDSFALGIASWRDILNRDPDEGAKDYRTEIAMRERRARAKVVGLNIPEPSWITH